MNIIPTYFLQEQFRYNVMKVVLSILRTVEERGLRCNLRCVSLLDVSWTMH